GLLELRHRPPAQGGNALRATFDARWGVRRGALASGVWRYGEAVLPSASEHILSYPEGNTPLLASAAVARWTGAPELLLKHEGQKTIVLELLQQLGWEPPDWIVVPAGNLGNTAAFGKALAEALAWGLIDRAPRLAAVQADGAAPFAQSFREAFAQRRRVEPHTVATAINIGNPVSYERAVRAIRDTNGVVTSVSDDEILEAKAVVDGAGNGWEP